ncbi:MAG: hypothetical protein RQ723_10830 [Desulfuromonadales bacterium]|nr:hypothetical protein [Desulfuromonadales bacterium]
MKTKAFSALLILLLLSACGPIIGGVMVAGNGVKDVVVTSGALTTLKPGSRIAVLGPFDKTTEAFYICRGEEAASFANNFITSGLFQAELKIDQRFPDKLSKVTDWQGQTPAAIQAALGLDAAPDLLLSGTILKREMVAAPMQGVIMHVAYRLDFLDVQSGRTVSVQVTVKELFQDAIPAVVADLARRIGA